MSGMGTVPPLTTGTIPKDDLTTGTIPKDEWDGNSATPYYRHNTYTAG